MPRRFTGLFAPLMGQSIQQGALTATHYAQVRNVIQIPFDDSIDGTHPLECFFQMPTGTVEIRSARVWVQRKSFRAYETAAASGGGSVTSNSGGATLTTDSPTHSHSVVNNNDTDTIGTAATNTDGPSNNSTSSDTPTSGNQQTLHTHGGGPTEAENHNHQVSHSHTLNLHTHAHSHTHTYAKTMSIGASGAHSHTVGTAHTHTVETAHTHGITYGIFEQAAAGTLSLFVANDGTNYGSAITSGQTAITNQDITSQLTKTSGDKRIKIEGTGLTRVQVLLLLDLIVDVQPLK